MESKRVFADTNLFLRYLTNDIPAKADAVEDLLERAARRELILVTSSLVIAEIVWTLESYYGLSKKEIRDKILTILSTPGLEVEGAYLAGQAISIFADKNTDYIDAYNTCWMRSTGLIIIYTFDKKHFSRIEGISPIEPGSDKLVDI